jgi:hypothetical protein
MRDLGLIALGFLAGFAVASAGAAAMAYDVESTDRVLRGLRLKFNTHVEGQG